MNVQIEDSWKVFSLLVVMLLTFAGCIEWGGYKYPKDYPHLILIP